MQAWVNPLDSRILMTGEAVNTSGILETVLLAYLKDPHTHTQKKALRSMAKPKR